MHAMRIPPTPTPALELVAPARQRLGGLGLVAVHVGDFALAVDDLDAALFELGDGLALHLGARGATLASSPGGGGTGRRGRGCGCGAAGLAHALLVAAAAAGAVLARHL